MPQRGAGREPLFSSRLCVSLKRPCQLVMCSAAAPPIGAPFRRPPDETTRFPPEAVDIMCLPESLAENWRDHGNAPPHLRDRQNRLSSPPRVRYFPLRRLALRNHSLMNVCLLMESHPVRSPAPRP